MMVAEARVRDVGTGTRLGFFGSMTLLAREMRSVLESRAFPAADVRLFDAAAEGTLSEFGGEALVVTRPDEDAIPGLDIAFLCGTAAEMAPYLDWPARWGFTAIDLSGAAFDRGAPLVHAGINPADIASGGVPVPLIAAPHAVAHNLVTLAAAARGAASVASIDAVAFRPVSEMGEKGIEELQGQTVGLLNFTEVPNEVLGRQVAFNLVPSPGVPSSRAEGFEERIQREVSVLAGLETNRVSLASAIAPLFHGHAMHVALRFGQPVTREGLSAAFEQSREVRLVTDPEAFSPVDLAGEETLAIGFLQVDETSRRAGFWSFCDNLRGGALLNAVRLAERLADLRMETSS